MTQDLYTVLQLNRDANNVDIKKAFRKLALKYNPNLPSGDSTQFESVAQAYSVLSDPQNKGIYDLYGDDRKINVTASADDVFSEFFGTSNPYQALEDCASEFSNLCKSPTQKVGKRKTNEFNVTLEDLFYGCTKVINHERKILKESGDVQIIDSMLKICVKPGTAAGTRFVFEGEGNQQPGMQAGPAVYKLNVLEHDRFSLEGNNLIHTASLPLVSALCGTTLQVKSLDGRTLVVPITGSIKEGSSVVVPGEGLPSRDGGFGDIIVKFTVAFPQNLSETQKTLLKAAFFLPQTLSNTQNDAVTSFTKAYKSDSGWSR